MFWSTAPDTTVYPEVSVKPLNGVVINPELTVAGLSAEQIALLEGKYEVFNSLLMGEDWEQFMNTKGVIAKKKFEPGCDFGLSKSQTVLPYHILDVLEHYLNADNLRAMDDLFDNYEVVQKLSNHSHYALPCLKGVLLVSPREFFVLSNLRLLADGSIVIIRTSVSGEGIRENTAGKVRGVEHLFATLLRPSEDGSGTEVHIVVHGDPLGSLPSSLANAGLSAHANGLVVTKSILEKKKNAGLLREVGLPMTYEDVVNSVAKFIM